MKPIRKLWWLVIIALLATGTVGWTIYAFSIFGHGQQ